MSPQIAKTLFPLRIEGAVSTDRIDDSPLGFPGMVGTVDQSGPVCARRSAATPDISIIIPARNEGRWLSDTLCAAVASVEHARSRHITSEIVVVDNQSTDATWDIVQQFVERHEIRAARIAELGAARARNHGRRHAQGRVLIFVDADTHLPVDAVSRIMDWCDHCGKEAGITRLASLERSWKASLWWTFWEHVRRLPLAYAKAMPAIMFCTADVFDEFGPFDEQVAIGEEWPILASVYRHRRHSFVYDRTLTGHSSSRRMERRRFGYVRTLMKYAWAILHKNGRIHYTDQIR